jgi:hypothetical protein
LDETSDLGDYWTEFHETLWCYRYMFLVGRKVFSFVVKGGINSEHHYLPTYQILMISGNVEFLPLIFYTVFWQPCLYHYSFRSYQWTEFHETLWCYRYMFLVGRKVSFLAGLGCQCRGVAQFVKHT